MTVIRPNSISGVTSITALANEINVFKHDGVLAGLQLNGVNHHTSSGVSTFHTVNVLGNLDVAGVLTYQDVTNVDSLGIGTFRTGINVSGGQLDVGSNIKLGNAGVITATSFVGNGSQLTGLNSDLVNDTSPQLGGNLDTNSHEISLDTSHAINFGDSNELRVFYHSGNGQIDFNGNTSLQLKTPANKYFQVVNRDNGNNIIQAQAGGVVQIYHNGSKKFETSNTGFTCSGTLNTSAVHTTASQGAVSIGGGGDIRLTNGSWTGDHAGKIQHANNRVYIQGGTDTYGHVFRDHGGGDRLYITDSGHVIPADDNSYDLGSSSKRFKNIYTSGNLVVASGKGIDFSADANGSMTNSEVLDDYEEGYYYPAAYGTSSTTSAYYYSGENKLGYVKIGKLVTIMGRLRLQAVNFSGGLRMTLPYAAVQGSNTSNSQMAAVGTHGVNFATASGNGHDMGLFIEIFPNTSYADFIICKDNQGWINATNSNIQANNYLAFNLSYVTND